MISTALAAFRLANTAATAYCCGKIGWEAFKGVRGMQQETIRAKELRDRFVEDYEAKNGSPPTEELIQTALHSYDAVEKPVRHKVRKLTNNITNRIVSAADSGLERVEKWMESREN